MAPVGFGIGRVMDRRYEIRDREHPGWRGQRFTSLDRARRELAHAVPPERWQLWDREEQRELPAVGGA